MLSCDESNVLVLLASSLIIFSTIATASVVGNDDWETLSIEDVLTGEYKAEHISFTVVESEEENFKIENYVVNIEDDEYHIFDEIEIECEDSLGDIQVSGDGGLFKFENNNFNFQLNDSEEGILKVGNHFIQERVLDLSITLGDDVILTENMNLKIKDRYDVIIHHIGDVKYSIEREPGELPEYIFELGKDGEIKSSIEEVTEVDKTPTKRPEDRPLPPITIGKKGIQEPSIESGLTVKKRNIKRGSVDLNISGEFEGSRIVRVSIDREMIGNNISDMDDIVVEVDGEEMDHYEEWHDIYGTDEPGYYLNMTKSETEVFVRMDFSEHNLRIYEKTSEDELSPYSYLGLLIGAIVVIAGAGLLFKKES
ncbi:MAG: hypothetical protein R6W73_05600 [Candidatus Saliniplasma sp.]